MAGRATVDGGIPPSGAARPARTAVKRAAWAAVGLFAALTAVLAGSAASALADDPTGTLHLEGLTATMQVGAPVPFSASVTNDSPDAAIGVRTLIRVALPGLVPRDIRIERRELDGSWAAVGTKTAASGEVRFVDDSAADRWLVTGGVIDGRYRLLMLSRAPTGVAVVAAETQRRVGGGWDTLARSPQYVTRVVAAPTGSGSHASASAQEGSVFPFSPAPTIAGSAPSIGLDLPSGGEAAAAAPAPARLLGSRAAVAVAIVVVSSLLVVASIVLRRELVGEVVRQGHPA